MGDEVVFPIFKEPHLMDPGQSCAECGAELEIGFIPDVSMPTAFKSSWHRGEPGDKTMLDYLKQGPGGVKYDRSQLIAIRALRCTKCGLLKLYANPKISD